MAFISIELTLNLTNQLNQISVVPDMEVKNHMVAVLAIYC